MPRVTVVLPVYNHESYVTQALGSLYSQDYQDFEIVAVDDGSTDSSLEVLNRHRPRILIIESNHHGPSSARNLAIQATDSEFVAFMDADDLCTPDRLRVEMQALEDRELDLVASALTYIDSGGQDLPGSWTCPAEAERHYWGALIERNWIGTPSVILRRKILDTSGLFDENFLHAEDYDLWLRIGRSHCIGYLGSALIHCRRHLANTSNDIRSHQIFERMALQKIVCEEAREAFLQLHSEEKRRAEAWIWFLLRRCDSTLEAEVSLALARHPESRSLRFAAGVMQYDSGDYEKSLSTFDLLKEFDVSALHNLGVVQARRGNFHTARIHLQAALDRIPGYVDAQHNLAALRNGVETRLTRRPLRHNMVPMYRQ
jgi:GT2 family glycosyltransferase